MDTISEKLAAILATAAELHDTDILWHNEHETLYEAINFYVCAQAAEIERLMAQNAALRFVLAAELSLADFEIDDRIAQVQP